MTDDSLHESKMTSNKLANDWMPKTLEERGRGAGDLVDRFLDGPAVISQAMRPVEHLEFLANLPFQLAADWQSAHRTELTAVAFDLLYRRLPRMPRGMLPTSTPPEQPGRMPRQSLTPARLLPRLRRPRRDTTNVGPT
jgi:hypothetical protein